MKLGDFIESIARPIARALGMMEPCDACKKRKNWLNRLHDRIFKPSPQSRCARHRAKVAAMIERGDIKFENGQWWIKKELLTTQ